MRVFQIICSRKKGIVLPFGENILYASEGVSAEEKEEISGRFRHASPGTNYSFVRLKTGRYCMCMTKYHEDGDDFCHGLILEEGFWSFYPVQLIDAPIFKDTIEGLNNSDGSLPALESIALGNTVTFDNVSQFIKTRIDQGLKEMINAAVDFKRGRRFITICDSEENIKLWLGAVMMAFPIKMAHEITFTTAVTAENSDEFMICCSTDDALYHMEDGKSYIFDHRRGIRGKPDISLKFIRVVEVGYLASKRTLDAFNRFASQFDNAGLNESIDDCYSLFIISYLRQTGMERGDIKSAFEFALTYGTQDMLDDIFQMTEPSMETLVRIVDIEAARPFAEFLFKTALFSQKLMVMDRVCYFFLAMLDHLVMDSKAPDVERILALYKDMLVLSNDKAHRLLRYATGEERISYIAALLKENCTYQKGEFYACQMLHSFMELGYLWSRMIQIKDVSILIDTCINSVVDSGSSIRAVLQTVTTNGEFLARAVVLLYNRIKSGVLMEELTEEFSTILDGMDDEQIYAVRKIISDMEGGRLLVADFLLRLSKAEDKTMFFNEYRDKVFERIPQYGKLYFTEAVKFYIKRLDGDSAYLECVRFIFEIIDDDLILDDGTIGVLIKGFESGLPIPPDDRIKGITAYVKNLKKTKSISTYPDITNMIDYALWLEKAVSKVEGVKEALEEAPDMGGLGDKRYKEYTAWCLPLMMKLIKSPEDHRNIIHFAAVDEMSYPFFCYYFSIMNYLIDKDRQRGLTVFVEFCVYYYYYLEPKFKILGEEELLDKIRELMLGVLDGEDKVFLKDVDAGIRREFSARGLSIPVKWTEVYDEAADKKGNSIIKSIAELFSRDKRK